MELTNATATDTPNRDGETQITKSLPCTNGALKKHKQHHRHHLTSTFTLPQPAVVVTYRECLKNHAARLGGHALDGCGEFMPSPTTNPTDPASLKCAACGCHRNFHRREPDDPKLNTHFLEFRYHPPPPPHRRASPSPSPSPSLSPPPPTPGMLLAQSTGVPEDQPTMNYHHPVATPTTPTVVKSENPSGRKRFRTKFSQDQKDKMLSFTEKLGWKIQKSDEGLVEEFCNQVGVSKAVLKVWMHNKKHAFGKKDATTATATAPTNANTSNGIASFDNNGHSTSINSSHHHNMNSGVHLHVSTNGSSSSS